MPEHRLVQQSYNRLSRWYDLFSGSEAQVSRKALELFQPRAGECLLEIGFGTVHALLAMVQQAGPRGQVTGLDISPGMVSVTSGRLVQANLRKRPLLTLGDAVRLPCPSGCFDGIFSAFTLELFSEKEIWLVLAECWRVLQAGGRIAVTSLYKPPAANYAVQIYEWFHQRMPNLVDCRPIPVQPMVAAAGFTVRDAVIQSIWGLPVQIVVAEKLLLTEARLPAAGS